MGWNTAAKRAAQSVARRLGQQVTYTAAGHSPFVILKAVFDAEYVSVGISDGVAVESRRPVLSVFIDDLNVDASELVQNADFALQKTNEKLSFMLVATLLGVSSG